VTMNPLAVRGTCCVCGRFLVTYVRKGETAPRAVTHNSFQGEVGDREWKTCPGSNQIVEAASVA
jgi:hypothetical protein